MYRTVLFLIMLMCLGRAAEGTLVGSPHDFSALGGSPCGYCHTIHNGLGGTGLLTPTFGPFPAITKIYTSVTRKIPISIAQVSASDARICLACHDSMNVANLAQTNASFAYVMQKLDGNPGAYIEVDLSNDHPVGFVYDKNKDRELKTPQTTRPIFGPSRDQMWCSTCHNVHDNSNGKFLVMSNDGSALCFDCHIK
ncbi:MAG TPA: cytochrome c3 family protein [Geobacteraceae bacterium]